MLTHLLLLGLLSAPADGTTETGTVNVSTDRTVVMAAVQVTASRGSSVPLGAGTWAQPYDPGDHAPYAIDFTPLLDQGEEIAKIEAVKVSATAALLGIAVDTAAGYRPIIDVEGKKIQLWIVVDEAYWEAASFAAAGVQLAIAVRVTTTATPPKRYERTAVLTVRQL